MVMIGWSHVSERLPRPHASKHIISEEISLQDRGEVILIKDYKGTWIKKDVHNYIKHYKFSIWFHGDFKCILLQNGCILLADILNVYKKRNASIILTFNFSLPTKKLFNFKSITLSFLIIVNTPETIYENYFYFGTGINCVHLSTPMEERLL